MKDWNVVVSLYQEGFRHAAQALREFGTVERSPYHNILLMKVDVPAAALAAIERKTEANPELYDAIARIAPATRHFTFQSLDEFKEKAKSAMTDWAPSLGGQTFHARLHRRAAHHELRTPDIEKFLDDTVIALTTDAGTPARISFADPDLVIAVDTVDDRAGIALWTREDLARHRLLRPD